jgi:hypothetical protein
VTFVLLYGPPAVGKLTVATELARETGFKLFHNHLSLDLVESIFPRGTPSFARVGRAVRELVFEEAAQEDINLIFTYVYEHPQDDPEMQWMLEVVERHGAATQLVQLTCNPEKLNERVGTASRRLKGKITDAELLGQLLEAYDLFTPYPERPSLQLDTTMTPPQETEVAIAAHLSRY